MSKHMQAQTATRPEKQPAVLFELKDDPELFNVLNQYRISVGWTWKRFMLTGMANSVSKFNENPDLIVRIADYLERKR